MVWYQILGWIAVGLGIVQYMPQGIKTLVTKDTKPLSLKMYVILFIGTALWFLYGALSPVGMQSGVANGIIIIVELLILYLLFNEKNNLKWFWLCVVIVVGLWILFPLGLMGFVSGPSILNLVISLIAGFSVTVSFVPQIIKTIKTNNTKNISALSLVTIIVSCTLWTIMFIGNVVANGDLLNNLGGIIFSALCALAQIPLLYKKVKNTSSK